MAAGAATVALAVMAGDALGAAVTYQADNAHSGFVADGPNPPLGRKWIRRDLGSNVSYPVIAEGKVYVTAVARSASSSGTGPTLLYALDRRTGGTVWVREVAALGSLAYDNGRVYVLGNAALDAVSAATGQRLWRLDLESANGGAPVADGAIVYASDHSGAHAVSADTGLILQTAPLQYSGFALSGERVFLAKGGCEELAAYTRALAQQVWDREGCPGFTGPVSPAFSSLARTVPSERLWARDASGSGGMVVDAVTSLGTEQFGSRGGLSFASERVFLEHDTGIEARNVESGTIQWRWQPGGTTSLVGSTLAVRDAVWALTSAGDVVAVRQSDGAELSRVSVGGPPSPPLYYGGARIHDGMAADAAGLVVPSGNRLAALGPGADAPGVLDPDKQPGGATKMSAALRPRDVEFGGKAVVSGSVRRSGDEVADQLELQADPYPYGVWERVGTTTARDGSFQLSHRPDRNTRYRVVDTSTAPAVISKTIQAYAFPRIRLKLGYRGARRTYFNSTIAAPDFLNLAKQRLYVYALRSKRAVGKRVGSIPIERVKGTRYRAARTLTTPSGSASNYFFICIKIKDTRQLTRLNGKAWGCGRSRF
jgi:outer membrane protein assembly factor BamB